MPKGIWWNVPKNQNPTTGFGFVKNYTLTIYLHSPFLHHSRGLCQCNSQRVYYWETFNHCARVCMFIKKWSTSDCKTNTAVIDFKLYWQQRRTKTRVTGCLVKKKAAVRNLTLNSKERSWYMAENHSDNFFFYLLNAKTIRYFCDFGTNISQFRSRFIQILLSC